jgi:glutamate-1-semialdehyde 2,1-aminomutase
LAKTWTGNNENHHITIFAAIAMKYPKSRQLQDRFHSIIPGGSHTYAKGDDQFPEFYAPYITRGKGCRVWDVDGNEFFELAMGLRSVTLGHAYEPVVEAACAAMKNGSNFGRPSILELECAEALQGMINGAEMVKFGKNGSDVTNAAIKLSRAHTGRDLVAVCEDHPFFSVSDWFIGSTPMNAGIPNAVQDLTLKFRYNDIESLKNLFERYPDQISCVILEAEKNDSPKDNFLHEVKRVCHNNGAVFILDEMITGFRWSNGGAQAYYDIEPDLSTFGKALGNGFSVAALAGKRELMDLGGIRHDKQRVFLLSLTNGAESGPLAAAMEIMRIYQNEPVIEHIWEQGERLCAAVRKSSEEHGLQGHVDVLGKPCCAVFTSRDQELKPSQPFRTLLLQETIKRGLIMPSLIVSYSHTDQDIDRISDIIHEALGVYRKALDEGVDKYLEGDPVKPVWRSFN